MTLLEAVQTWATKHDYFVETKQSEKHGRITLDVTVTTNYCEFKDGTKFCHGDIVLMALLPEELFDFIGLDFYPPHFADNQLNGNRGRNFTGEKLLAILEAEEAYSKLPNAKTYANSYSFN